MLLPPFKLERYFAQYEFHVEYTLCSSDSESVSVGTLLDMEPDTREKLEQLWLGYTESPGALTLRRGNHADLRDDSARKRPRPYRRRRRRSFCSCTASQSGDHVIVHSPFYQSLGEVAASIGCEVTHWQAREENAWALDVDELRGLIRPKTRVLIINTPHNPTGYLMSRADYRTVHQIRARTGNHCLF